MSRRAPARRWSPLAAVGAALAACGIMAAGSYVAVRPAAGPIDHGQTRRPASQPTESGLPPLPIGQLGVYHVAKEYFVFAEPPHGSAGPRLLHVTMRFPVGHNLAAHGAHAPGLFPLLVFAPGFRQCSRSYRDLLTQWTTAGYVVAAVDFPLTSCTTSSPTEADLANQPADIAFVIRRLIRLSSSPHGRLSGLIDPAMIALAGHSDGGDTVAAMAAASCCRDSQVRAVVVLAGAEWPPLQARWFAAPTPPMMFVQGTADTWNYPAASMQLYKGDTTGKRYYLNLPGADHLAPYEGHRAPEPIVARVTIDFLDFYVLGQRARIGAMWRASRVPGVAELVRGGQLPR